MNLMNTILFSLIFTLLVPILFVSITAQEFTLLELIPTDDASVKIDKNESSDQQGLSKTNTGDLESLIVEYSYNATPRNEQITGGAFLKFDLSDINSDYVESAHLGLWLSQVMSRVVPTPVSVFFVEDETWSESDVTYETKPIILPNPIDTIDIDLPKWYHWDITDIVKQEAGSKVSMFLLITTAKNNEQEHFTFFSKDHINKQNIPQLNISYSDPDFTPTNENESDPDFTPTNENESDPDFTPTNENESDPDFTPTNENESDYTLAIIAVGLIASVIAIGILLFIVKRNISAKLATTQNNINELKTLTKTDTVSEDQKELRCSSCGKKLSRDFKLCPYCGHLTE